MIISLIAGGIRQIEFSRVRTSIKMPRSEVAAYLRTTPMQSPLQVTKGTLGKLVMPE
jgi:hypothetical protein